MSTWIEALEVTKQRLRNKLVNINDREDSAFNDGVHEGIDEIERLIEIVRGSE